MELGWQTSEDGGSTIHRVRLVQVGDDTEDHTVGYDSTPGGWTGRSRSGQTGRTTARPGTATRPRAGDDHCLPRSIRWHSDIGLMACAP